MQFERDREFEPMERPRDKEITLGPILLAGLGVGLLTLCCICFLAGYAAGHRSSAADAGQPQTALKGRSAAEILAQSQSKAATAPVSTASQSAAPQPAVAATAAPARLQLQPPPAPRTQPVIPAQYTPAAPATAPAVVRPALAQSAPAAGSWMVQIASVEHTEDADVLVSALKKRGYSVSVRHDPLDNLLHVQVGPFASRSDADSMREKLLGDGYNAILLQ